MADAGRRLLVAGAGDVGMRLARLRAGAGDEVFTLRRTTVETSGAITPLAVDLVSGQGLSALPGGIDAVVFAAAPDQRDEATYRRLFVDGQQRLLDALGAMPRRWLFVSSTAVYAEDRGGWVDEASPTQPDAFNGRILREAERRIAASCPGACALRLTGLYGPGREGMRRRALSMQPPRPRWTNRIHLEDAASALSHLLELEAVAPRYLGSDDAPAREDEVHAWLRAQAGLGALPVRQEPVSGRRVSNALLRSSGWAPRYPDYRTGYPPPSGGAG